MFKMHYAFRQRRPEWSGRHGGEGGAAACEGPGGLQ